MSVVDIHPEELLDKSAAGSLSANEEQLLKAHLARCEVCRFELALRSDLADDVAERELMAPPQLSSQMPLPPRATPSRVRRWSLAWGAAAAVFVLAAGALGAYAVRWPHAQRSALSAVGSLAAPQPSARAPVAKSRARRANTEQTNVVAPSEAVPSLIESALPARSPAVSAPASRSRDRIAPPAPPALSDEAVSAQSLFAAANRARRAGDVTLAKQLYASLQRQFPRSSEASISRVTSGSLLLNGDPVSALANFDAYLASGAQPLAAEALVGRARALRAMGRTAESMRAWQDVATRFPTSVYAAEAREMTKPANAP